MVDVRATKVDSQTTEYLLFFYKKIIIYTLLFLLIHVLLLGRNVTPYLNEVKTMLNKTLHYEAIFATVAEAVVVCSQVCCQG